MPRQASTRVRAGHPTIATIAAQMGLSRATVTHVLNGRAGEQRIRPETQRRVIEVARELGYRANASARAVRAGRFGNVALIQSQLGHYLPAELLFGLTSAIAAHGLRLAVTEVPDVDAEDEVYFTQAMHALSADGVFVNRHGSTPAPYLERIRQLRVPAVFLNSKQEFDCIHPDDLQGGRLATEHLLGLGHERIAYVETHTRPIPHYSERDRRAGYEQAMILAGLTPRVHPLPYDWHSTNAGTDARVEAAARLLQGLHQPTAIVAYEHTEAMAVVRAAHILGIDIPGRLSLIQFHHETEPRHFIPIHTVTNAMREVGAGGVAMLLEKMESPERPLPARAVPEILIEGATCQPANRVAANN